MLFLLQAWDKPMNYQRKDTMADVESKEKAFSAFFLKVQALLQEQKSKIQTEAWNSKDMELHTKLQTTQKEVHAAMLDNFNTPVVMNALVSIVNASNAYMINNDERKPFLLRKVAVYVTRILRVFGLVDEPDRDFGWDNSASSSSGKSHQDVAEPFVKALVQYRTQVRDAARSKAEHTSFLKLSDQLRDDVLPDLGVKLADDDPTFPFYFVDPAILKREKDEKVKQENLKKRQKAERELTAKQNKLKEYKNGEVNPFDFIKQEYQITLNADGTIPASAVEAGLSKSKQKEIPKAFTKQQKAHEVYKTAIAANPSVVSDLEKEIQAIEATLKTLE
jgi:cysteinyl-tRNA synthetase